MRNHNDRPRCTLLGGNHDAFVLQKTAGPAEVQENAGMRDVRMELVRSMEECARLQELLSKAEEELRATMEE